MLLGMTEGCEVLETGWTDLIRGNVDLSTGKDTHAMRNNQPEQMT